MSLTLSSTLSIRTRLTTKLTTKFGLRASARLRRILLLLPLFLSVAGSAGAASETVSLDGDWQFTFKHLLTNDTPEQPDASAYDITLPVPSYWRSHNERYVEAAWWPELNREPAPLMGLHGAGFYRKKIDVPQEWSG